MEGAKSRSFKMLRLPTETPNIEKLLNMDPQIIIQYGEIEKIQSVATDLGYGNFSIFLDKNEINKMYRVLVLSQILIQAYQKLQLEQINEIQKITEQLAKLESEKDKQLQKQRLELEKYKDIVIQLKTSLEVLWDNQKYITENSNVIEELNSVKQVQQLIAQSQISIIEAQKQSLQMQQTNQRRFANQQQIPSKASSPPHIPTQQSSRQSVDTNASVINSVLNAIKSPKEFETSELENSFRNNPSNNSQQSNSQQKKQINSTNDIPIQLSVQQQTHSIPGTVKNAFSPQLSHRNRQLIPIKKYRHVDRYGNVWPIQKPQQYEEQ